MRHRGWRIGKYSTSRDQLLRRHWVVGFAKAQGDDQGCSIKRARIGARPPVHAAAGGEDWNNSVPRACRVKQVAAPLELGHMERHGQHDRLLGKFRRKPHVYTRLRLSPAEDVPTLRRRCAACPIMHWMKKLKNPRTTNVTLYGNRSSGCTAVDLFLRGLSTAAELIPSGAESTQKLRPGRCDVTPRPRVVCFVFLFVRDAFACLPHGWVCRRPALFPRSRLAAK